MKHLWLAPAALALSASVALSQELAAETMEFGECLKLIDKLTEQYEAPPTEVVSTDDLRVVRFPVTDGTVLMSCSRTENKMTLRKDG